MIEHYWNNVLENQHIRLNWLPENEWDGGYHDVPQEHFDVFVYDMMFMDHYQSQGWLCEFDRHDITYAHEINPNILSLAYHHDKYHGIPIYGCIYVIFYRSNDEELASVKTFEELINVASKRHFIMRKPGRTVKTLTYLTLLESTQRCHDVTEETLNRSLVNRLSYFYQHSKYLLDKTDRYAFDQSSFYIGYTEDLNTRLLVNEQDLSVMDFKFVPLNNHGQTQCWLNCVGIHPASKSRQSYEKSLQLANLMTSSSVMNEYFQGQHYTIPSNQVTLTRLASNNSIYAKLQTLMESTLFRPSSSLPLMINSPIALQERWAQTIAVIIAQHQKDMQTNVNPISN